MSVRDHESKKGLIRNAAKSIFDFLMKAIVHAITFPYYRSYHYNTVYPLNRIAIAASRPSDSRKLHRETVLWRARKLIELQFISICSAVVAAGVISAFSWNTIDSAYFLTYGFWYGSLILSIFGIMLSTSQVTLLNIIGPIPPRSKPIQANDAIKRYEPLLLSKKGGGEFVPRKKMLFAWQCPMMFMSYSVCAFLIGLTVLVCTPLIKYEGWNADCTVAVWYLGVFAIVGPMFTFCSFWVYHYVDLDFVIDTQDEDGMDGYQPSQYGNMVISLREGRSSSVVSRV